MILIRRVSASGFKQLGSVDLHVPRRGRFLVRGLNEAGKSTLFEAIYFALFGRPLVADTGHARLDDVISYGADEAKVSLEVSLSGGRAVSGAAGGADTRAAGGNAVAGAEVGAADPNEARGDQARGPERILRVRRTIRRSRPNAWELDIVAPDGAVEEVRGNRVVNERIEAELGFDGDALLNTCFVEQKKLEKLEGMSRAQREQSLMRLFNMDRLLEIGDELKVRHADEAAVARQKRRAELADLQARIPEIRVRHGELTSAAECAGTRDSLRELSARLQGIERSRVELEAAQAEAARLRGRAAAAELVLGASTALREARTARDRARGADGDAKRLDGEFRGAHEAHADELRITARGRAIGRLKRRHSCMQDLTRERQALLGSVAEADASLDLLARDRESLNDVRRALVQARAAAQDAERAIESLAGDERGFDVRDAIGELLAAQSAQLVPDDDTALVAAIDERDVAANRRTIEASATAVIAILLAVGSYWLWPLLLGAALLLAVLAWRWLSSSRRVDALTAAVGRMEGERSVRDRDRLRQAAREEEARQKLRELNAIAPATPERAQEALGQLDDRLGERSRGDVAQAVTQAREARERAAAQTATLSERESELARRCAHVDGAALGRDRDARAARAERIGMFLERREPVVARQAHALAVALDAAELEQELGALRLALTTARDTARRAPDIEREAATARGAAEMHWGEAEAAWLEATSRVAEAVGTADGGAGAGGGEGDGAADGGAGAGEGEGDGAADGGAGEGAAGMGDGGEGSPGGAALSALGRWSRDVTDADWNATAAGLDSAYEATGGDTVRAAADAATARAANLAGGLEATEAAFTVDVRAVREDDVKHGIPEVPSAPTRDELDAAADALERRVPDSVADLVAGRDAALAELTSAVGVADRLARDLSLSGEDLDAAVEAGRYEQAAHDLAVRRRAVEIVGLAGRNVMQRVLPQTIQHMRGLLPRLTQGRYFDVQLSDDYRIEVYDDRAQGWKKKSIFSGGTRDQMSLTLRLAFALATLPEERGARPGFLFLDEPLGAFDDQRAAALIGLLTEGQIADSFDQVFLISHVRVDESLFDYRITMSEGRIVDSNLPEPAQGQTATE